MPTCKDCFHYDVCQYHVTEETNMTVNECSHRFINKSDVIEVRHGAWVDRYGEKYDNHLYECSVCKEEALCKVIVDELWHEHIVQKLTPTCPNCGAKMDGKSEGE